MKTPAFLLTILVGVSACQEAPSPSWNADATADSARQFVDGIPDRLLAEGPQAWGDLFDHAPSMFMASDGQMAFSAHDSLTAFLDGFAPTVASLDLAWEEVRIDALAPGLVTLAIPYRERIVMTTDSVSAFGGYVTGVARSRAGDWTLQHLHWSSPAQAAD